MTLFETLRIAKRALFINRLRSFLTILGVIIGVAAVVAMVAIGQGAKASVEAAFAKMGTNLLVLLPGSSSAGGMRGGFGSRPTLTWEDLKSIQTEVPSVRAAAAQLHANAQVLSDDQNWATSITGTSPEYFDIRNWRPVSGALFSQADLDSGNKVAVLGQTVADKLYGPYDDPVGRTLRIRNIPFQVVGVLGPKGQSSTGQDYDDAVFIPQSTFGAKIQGGLHKYVSGWVLVSAVSAEAIPRAEEQITALLRDRHHLAVEADDDFSIRNLTEMANAQQQGTDTLTMLLASIAAVSLLVGGIGIMNIMLVSVTERTREIGLRMALGAMPRHILAQFLVEAVTLSMIGGLMGIVLGALIAQQLANQLGWPILIQPIVMLVAVGFSALVGVGFGLYPARKAARLNPIDALRYE